MAGLVMGWVWARHWNSAFKRVEHGKDKLGTAAGTLHELQRHEELRVLMAWFDQAWPTL